MNSPEHILNSVAASEAAAAPLQPCELLGRVNRTLGNLPVGLDFASEEAHRCVQESPVDQSGKIPFPAGLVVPLRGFFRPDIKAVTSAMNSDQTSVSNTKLVPVGEVARQLGYRDPRNFRLSVAPRIGLAVVRVGLRWFVAERDFARVLTSVTAATTGEGHP
jgi:hypothetical protein